MCFFDSAGDRSAAAAAMLEESQHLIEFTHYVAGNGS